MGGYQGTVCVSRYGISSRDTSLLNNDFYTFNGVAIDEIIEIKGPYDSEGNRMGLEDHHTPDIPHRLKNRASNALIARLEEIRFGNLSDSNFINP